MKIKKIEVKNFKAVSNQVADFNGCSAIITAGNNKGKTSLLRGLIDRIRGEKPDLIVKQGEDKGYNIIEFSDGSKIEWSFTEKTEKITYITKEGIKQTSGVISALSEKIFGKKFDIDKFLQSTPKEQIKSLQGLCGLDFTEIDNRYKIAYDERTIANRKLEDLRADKKTAPEKKELRTVEEIKYDITEKRRHNESLNKLWEEENEKLRTEVEIWNKVQNEKDLIKKATENSYNQLLTFMASAFSDCINFEKAIDINNSIEKPQPLKAFTPLQKPELNSTENLELELENAQRLCYIRFTVATI